jgi:hypothetical protein
MRPLLEEVRVVTQWVEEVRHQSAGQDQSFRKPCINASAASFDIVVAGMVDSVVRGSRIGSSSE